MTAINPGTGHKTGEAHHRAKLPDSVVERARKLHDRGYKPMEVRGHLADEGHVVPLETLCNWLDYKTRTT